MLRETRKKAEFRAVIQSRIFPVLVQYEYQEKMGNLEKETQLSGVEFFSGEKRSNAAILCSSLCSLRGVEQGNLENASAEKDEDLYNEGS